MDFYKYSDVTNLICINLIGSYTETIDIIKTLRSLCSNLRDFMNSEKSFPFWKKLFIKLKYRWSNLILSGKDAYQFLNPVKAFHCEASPYFCLDIHNWNDLLIINDYEIREGSFYLNYNWEKKYFGTDSTTSVNGRYLCVSNTEGNKTKVIIYKDTFDNSVSLTYDAKDAPVSIIDAGEDYILHFTDDDNIYISGVMKKVIKSRYSYFYKYINGKVLKIYYDGIVLFDLITLEDTQVFIPSIYKYQFIADNFIITYTDDTNIKAQRIDNWETVWELKRDGIDNVYNVYFGFLLIHFKKEWELIDLYNGRTITTLKINGDTPFILPNKNGQGYTILYNSTS